MKKSNSAFLRGLTAKRSNRLFIAGLTVLCTVITACRHEEPILPPEEEQTGDTIPVTPPDPEQPSGDTVRMDIVGFYLLNEGNMGSNKASLDYYDYASATYRRNIYAEANPNVPKEMGDVGNDLQIYGGRLYAVINCSNKVEVMDAKTTKRIGQIDIPNCRYICFDGPYGYVTSYAGPVSLDASHAQIGYVARFDTTTLEITGTCLVGYQPDELTIVGNKMYVANSGGYMVPNYENTLSVIDIPSFAEIKRIPIAINLHRVRADKNGLLWVTSRGDYYTVPAKLYCVDPKNDQVIDSLDIAVSDLDIAGDSLYACATAWDYIKMCDVVSYSIVDINTRKVVCDNFITDGTDQKIKKPYGVKVHPQTREIYLTDAKNYVTPGMLYCFSPAGVALWSVRTGDIPAHFAFLKMPRETAQNGEN